VVQSSESTDQSTLGSQLWLKRLNSGLMQVWIGLLHLLFSALAQMVKRTWV
jgi:hypothetical protein